MGERVTRGKAIRLKCLDCCMGQSREVKLCPCVDCPLHRYRLGRETTLGEVIIEDDDQEV